MEHPAIIAFLNYLSREQAASAHTKRAYACDLGLFIEYLTTVNAETDPLVADAKRLRGFSAWLSSRGDAASTVARRLASLRSFYRFHRRDGSVASDPTASLRNPKQAKRLPRALRVEEIIALLDGIQGTSPLKMRDRSMFELLYGGGLRVAELVALNLDDIDQERKAVLVRGKGRRERLAPIGPMALDWLERWRSVRSPAVAGERAVYLNRFGSRLSTRSVDRIFQTYISASGLDPRASPHALRHSFATHMLDQGADLRSVQELLGHRRLTSTQVYTYISQERLRDAYQRSHPRA